MRRGPATSYMFHRLCRNSEINALAEEPCRCVVVRSGQEPIVVNLQMETPEPAGAERLDVPFHPNK